MKIANNTKINHIMVSFTDHYNAISTERLPSKTKIRKVSWYFNNSLLCKPKFPSVIKTFLFSLKRKKVLFSKWLVLKRMLRFFLKISPLKEILQFQDRICFFFLIKNTKSSHPSASDWWGNNKSSFKENARIFLKNSTTHENIKILRLKEEYKTYTKKKTSNQNYINDWKLKRWTLSIRKQTSKRCLTSCYIRQKLDGKKCSKTFFKVLEKQNM